MANLEKLLSDLIEGGIAIAALTLARRDPVVRRGRRLASSIGPDHQQDLGQIRRVHFCCEAGLTVYGLYGLIQQFDYESTIVAD
ncbi:hypothetical protein EOA33_06030 [Mesorhizobium sp. M4A.F.Ca.ET.050.02.1.1]|uniref:hypothetical protein n=1 Tax=Mesorhizobium sp. M4A.F.Ca.ET.050.02.1.1 TaxID=2496754 RepID=UPI000FCCA91E|nr:hypothetical protein [Mesorhizobium sp. M4A.F.Ca.ET.050.02.1.1]RUX51514.1 hypothetical protein EOA33_06030 [Mesorhizobium sp. M4A.F.Ca.ET.050.02.1.1]